MTKHALVNIRVQGINGSMERLLKRPEKSWRDVLLEMFSWLAGCRPTRYKSLPGCR